MRSDWPQILRQARREGILPADDADSNPIRPWPMVLLTGLGAWLAAVPIFLLFAYLLRDALQSGVLMGLLGGVLLWLAGSVLRARAAPLFVEQFALPLLLAGFGMLGVSLSMQLSVQATFGVLCLMLLLFGWLLPQHGLRVLLGALAPLAAVLALQGYSELALTEVSGVVLLLCWLVARYGQQQAEAVAQWQRAQVLASLGNGWVAMLLLMLAMSSAGGEGPPLVLATVSLWAPGSYGLMLLAFLQVLPGAILLAKRWPQLRQPWCAGVALVLLMLAALIQPLGTVMLIAAVCLYRQQWRMAIVAALAAVWMIAAFYYSLDLLLLTKAAIMLAAAVALGVLSWLAGARLPAAMSGHHTITARPWQRSLIALSVLAALLLVNIGIWQKETLIRDGQPLFVALAPVDPRSLMQGDYMALNFQNRQGGEQPMLVFDRQHMVLKYDARGVVTAVRPNDGRTLAADELAVELVFKKQRWLLVTDAFFFKEGEAARWAKARYGEFRVDANGKALLVGLRGEGLAPL